MPVEFTRNDACIDIHEQIVCGSMKLVMAYDGSGRRISKTRMRDYGNGIWQTELVTHYSGIGTEVRENFAGATPETKVVVNMPQGLGRYGIEDAADPLKGISLDENGKPTSWSTLNPKFEWYLKNHLGSTMLVYATGYGTPGSYHAAYDYRAFGEQVTLSEPADKVTENFTGKERDDETELSYHEARYLDPMLGVWISVDPKRFFNSPYLYMGNGYNPIKSIDEDGLDPEDGFNNMDAAVLDVGYFYQDQANMENAEFAGLIYELDGLFFSTYGVKGNEDSSYPYEAESLVPEEGHIVANWHNHGRYLESYGSGNYEMSENDYENYKDHMIYMIPAKKVELNGLGRPVKKYNPVTGVERSIGYVDKFEVRNFVNSSKEIDNHNRAER